MIAAFEEARRKAAERPNAPAVLSSSTLKTSDFGKLDWPVDGSIIYRFGRAVNPNNTTIRWNGVGHRRAERRVGEGGRRRRGDGGRADRNVRPHGDRRSTAAATTRCTARCLAPTCRRASR